MSGRNLWHSHRNDSLQKLAEKSIDVNTPCVFLSHSSANKAAARDIAEFLTRNDINVYIDEQDMGLQSADDENDHEAVVEHIQRGICVSSHMLAIVSNDSKNSWWISYEIGFADSENTTIGHVVLDEVFNRPSFIEITDTIESGQSLKEWVARTTNRRTRLDEKTASRTIPDIRGLSKY